MKKDKKIMRWISVTAMFRMGMVVGIFMTLPCIAGVVKNVTAKQVQPWDGLVEIGYELTDDLPTVSGATVEQTVTIQDIEHGTNVVANTFTRALTYEKGTHRIVWNARADGCTLVSTNVIVSISLRQNGASSTAGVQLWENGPYWAECNVGASKPEEYGYYFWWGDTVGYTRKGGTLTAGYYYSGVTWVSSTGTRMSSSPFSSSTCPTYDKNNLTLQSLGYIDSTGNIVAAHDAATAHLGAPWRLPTKDEFRALYSNCDTTWTMRNGVYGRLVTGKGSYSSKSIFLPAAGNGYNSILSRAGEVGCYFSSTANSDFSSDAWGLVFNSSKIEWCWPSRYCGRSVRPIRGFSQLRSAGSADSSVISLDLRERTSVSVVRGASLSIDYDAAYLSKGETALVTLNGTVIAEGTRGTIAQTVSDGGTLTLKTFVGGVDTGLCLIYQIESKNAISGTTYDTKWSLSLDTGRLDVEGTSSSTIYPPNSCIWPPFEVKGEIPFSPDWLAYAPSITNVVIAEGISEIGSRAFLFCGGLKSVSLPSTLWRIDDWAFSYCSNLTSIELPQRLYHLGKLALHPCPKLAEIRISSVNPESDCGWETRPFFSVVGGLLYYDNTYYKANGDREYTLHACPEALAATDITIRQGTTVIAYGAFSDCKNIESIALPESLKTIEEYAFNGCSNLTEIVIPQSVTKIGAAAFEGCKALTNIVFEGNAPTASSSAFSSVANGCTATVHEGSAGWDDDGDGKWNGLTLVYREGAIPDLGENPTSDQIRSALSGSADSKLSKYITSGVEYAAYRAWARSVKGSDGQRAGTQAVTNSPYAWLSFALGSETLIENAPTNGQMKVTQFEPTTNGLFDFTIGIEDVDVGSSASVENLKQVFGLEGGTSLDAKDMSSENVDITFDPPVDGKVKFTAGPKNANEGTFFMKVKMTP